MEIKPIWRDSLMGALCLYIVSLFPDIHDERDFYLSSLKGLDTDIVLTDSPELADKILITDVFEINDFEQVRNHSLAKKYPNKSLVITESDQPIELWPGLYTCGIDLPKNKNQIQGWFYPYFRVRFPNKELLEINCPEPLEKKFLASFRGYPSHILRQNLSKYWGDHEDIYISVTKDYHHFATDNKIPAETAQQQYINTIRSSYFSLCPRGRGPSTIRLFESMQLGVPPVIISDQWLPPPFIDWESCSVIIKENQIRDIHDILNPLIERSSEMGNKAQNIFAEYFTPEGLSKSMKLAIDGLSNSITEDWNQSSFSFHKTRIGKKIRFKFDYYKALFYAALKRIG